jgi:hypothetical protein
VNERWRKPVIPIDVEDSDKSSPVSGSIAARPSPTRRDAAGGFGHGRISAPSRTRELPAQTALYCYPMAAMDDVFEEMAAGEESRGPGHPDAESPEIAQEIVDRGNADPDEYPHVRHPPLRRYLRRSATISDPISLWDPWPRHFTGGGLHALC